MCGKDCDICGKSRSAELHIVSAVDKDYSKSVCSECWMKMSKKEKWKKKLRARIGMY